MEVITKNAKATQALGAKIAADLIRRGQGNQAAVVLLSGELGSGKTTLVQGLLIGLGITERILSPTYILSKQYALEKLPFTAVYHIDLYRLKSSTDLAGIGLSEIISDPNHIVAIEWPERLENQIPSNAIKINCEYINENERKISVV